MLFFRTLQDKDEKQSCRCDVLAGLILATVLFLLGIGAGYRQVSTLKRVRAERFMAGEDRRYFRQQAIRRLVISGLLLIIGNMIFVYYFSGMDARMDAIPERNREGGPPPPDDSQAQEDKHFTRLVAYYWIAIILILGVAVGIAILDVWATRKYWMVRYREIKAEHEAKLQRDLAVYRQQKLNERVKGLKKPDDDTAEEPPVEE
jgi:hypothetical protein